MQANKTKVKLPDSMKKSDVENEESFIQNEYEKLFQEVNEEADKLLYEDICLNPYNSISEFPPSIQRQIRNFIIFVVLMWLICISTVILDYINYFIFPLCIVVTIYLIYRCCYIYNTVKNKRFTVFSGVVVNYKESKMNFITSSKRTQIQITDGNKFLSCTIPRRAEKKGFFSFFKKSSDESDKGIPITLYIDKKEPIVNTELGPYIKNYLAIEYSALDDKRTKNIFKDKKEIYAKDYLSNEDI